MRGGVGEAPVLAPLVALICDDWPGIFESCGYSLRKDLYAMILEWLRGLIWHRSKPDQLRARIRDRLLEHSDNGRNDFNIEALALLGPDLDTRAEQELRSLAVSAPGRLAPSVEQLLASHSLAQRNPELLAELAEAYYIELPAKGSSLAIHYDPLDDGVRGHHRPGSGLGSPMVGWHYGPFWGLLAVHPPAGSTHDQSNS